MHPDLRNLLRNTQIRPPPRAGFGPGNEAVREILAEVTLHCVVTVRTVAGGRGGRRDGKDPTRVREPGGEAFVEAEGRGVV